MFKIGIGDSPEVRAMKQDIEAYAAEFEKLRTADAIRLTRLREIREENEDLRSKHRSRVETYDYGRRQREDRPQRHNIALPFGLAITAKHTYRIAGRLPDLAVPRREESEEERFRSDTMEKMAWGIIGGSGGDVLFSDGGWDGSQFGSTCFDLCLNLASQIPHVRPIEPSECLVIKGVDDPHDFERFYRFWNVPVESAKAQYGERMFRELPVQVSNIEKTSREGGVDLVTLVEVATRTRVLRFALGGKVGLFEERHNLGFVPRVVIPNIGPYRDVWGWGDYEFVRDLLAYIPALFSREADIIRMVANGAYVEKGTGQDPNVIQSILRKGGVITSKREGTLEPVQPPDVPAFEPEHAARAIEFLKMLGFLPDASWGAGIGRSGVDRGLQLMPQIEFTALKQTNWSRGLERLFSLAFRMIESQQLGTATYRGATYSVGGRIRTAFAPFQIGPGLPAEEALVEFEDDTTQAIFYPRTPAELFDGDYHIEFNWQNRVDPDDPAYVLSELNKFQQGAQSLRTTLERLGVKNPEDEMTLIEEESERFPWLREGMISFIKAQLTAQGVDTGGGGGGMQSNPLLDALSMMNTKDGGALGADAAAAGLGGGVPGELYGGA